MERMWAGFFEKLTAVNAGEMTPSEEILFYQEMVDTDLLKSMSDAHRARAQSLMTAGKIRKDPPVDQVPVTRTT